MRRALLHLSIGVVGLLSPESALGHWTESKYVDIERTSNSFHMTVSSGVDGLLDALSVSSAQELPQHKLLITKILVGDFHVGSYVDQAFVPCSKKYTTAEIPTSVHEPVRARVTFNCFTTHGDLHLKEVSSSNLHRTFLHITNGKHSISRILSADEREISLTGGQDTFLQTAVRFLFQGGYHMVTGYDHLLFVLLLLLNTGPLMRTEGWQKATRALLAVVSAFTVGHSISLVSSTLGLVHLPPEPVEVVIAGSIVVVALLNMISPQANHSRVSLALTFGVIHGFGFAGALGELGLPTSHMVVALAAFNLGIEGAQVIFVGLFLAPLAAMAISKMYRPVVQMGGSAILGLLALVWVVERLRVFV